ncbi:MAG: prepilin-type N-terminal cleavage/methylation domain-containing protein [Granulosicoccaceae bacterium]
MTRCRACVVRNRGFSLLEVLVAFSILTLALGVLFSLFSTGLRNTSVAREHSHAIALAESRLAEIGAVEPLETGEWEGDFDDQYRWRIQVTDYPWNNEPAATLPPVVPYQVTVEVTWASLYRERSVALTTLRLVNRQ